ncbi:MAG: FkbM family methyltransferase [Acetobacteraceae bacterium]
MSGLVAAPPGSQRVLAFNIVSDPVALDAAAEFTSGFEEGTIRFFDLVLPRCDRMIDFGAYIGFTALHAASRGVEVHAFEPNPVAHDLLVRNVAANPGLAPRMHLFRHGLGPRDEEAILYAKARADSGASLHQTIERGGVVQGAPAARIQLRDAAAVLRETGIDRRTLLKIDIEGAEYQVLPAIAPLLAEAKPWLHVSFHPFNMVCPENPYRTELLRLRGMLDAAEALAPYRFLHVFSRGLWETVEADDRLEFLRHYLLRAKPVPRIRTPQYGFVDAVAFSVLPLPRSA